MPLQSTKEHILNVAERLFADRGYAATSLRAITQAAGVNLGAVNYHFGSKEGLLFAVFGRRVGPVNEERLRLLDACEADGAALSLEAVLRAFIAPVFSAGRRGDTEVSEPFTRLIGRLYAEPVDGLTELYHRQFGEVSVRFLGALSRTLPGLTPLELNWRFQFLIGMIVHPLLVGPRLADITGGRCTLTRASELTDRLVRFAAAGMRSGAPAHSAAPRSVKRATVDHDDI